MITRSLRSAAAPWPRRREGSFRTVFPERFYLEVPEVRDGSSIDPAIAICQAA